MTNKLFNLAIIPLLIIAQKSPLDALIFNQPPPPPDKDTPGQQADSGTRGPCDAQPSATDKQLVAFVPTIEKTRNSLPETHVWGLTQSQHPTFWFYLPATAASAQVAQFSLENEADYQSNFQFNLPQTPGIISLAIPTNEPPLEPGQWYYWSLKLYCQTQPSTPNFFVDGWIQRVQNDTPFNSDTPQDKIVIYAQNGLWFDTITELANLHRQTPQETEPAWADLLEYIGWESLAEKPILPCCTLEKQ
ncbi:MAG: DUF928 domain-containing protein [Coleofasciculus sp. B1-GNL1-01]|uniref:DUF928 domain-containing protein n=1 Tax=Coleofasciculus sp. B1-GNL1-01 TaxID=3068484 RepID=UPI00330106F3